MPLPDATATRPSGTSAIFGDDRAAAAMAYAALGLLVFPIHSVTPSGGCSCGIPACRNAGKHPRTAHGLLEASTAPNQIRTWWQRWPQANIGIVTGRSSGVWVFDVDPAHSGLDSLERLEAEHGRLTPTWAVVTGSEGIHLWFQFRTQELRNSAGTLGPGLDVRGEGGYVIVPPSRHRSGNAYLWGEGWHPTQFDLAPAPSWLETMAVQASRKMIPPDRPPIGAAVGGNHFSSPSTDIPQGSRNATLTRLAGAMRRHGAGEQAIVAALLVENVQRCKPPLPEAEIATIARSVVRYPPENPSRLVRPGQHGKSFVQFVDGKAVAG